MTAKPYLEGLASHGVADAARVVRDLLLSTATPETDAEALAYAAASMSRTMRASVLAAIASAHPLRALDIGPYARALAADGAVLGEIREAGLEDGSLRASMRRADPGSRAAYEAALEECEVTLRAARIRERAAAEIAATNAKAAATIAALQGAAADARSATERAIAAVLRRAVDAGRVLETAIEWTHTGDGEHPYRATFDGRALLVRINDFPAESLYSLLVDGVAVQDLEDWPPAWSKPAPPQHLLDLLRPRD